MYNSYFGIQETFTLILRAQTSVEYSINTKVILIVKIMSLENGHFKRGGRRIAFSIKLPLYLMLSSQNIK